MIRFTVALILVAIAAGFSFAWLFWKIVGRSLAVTLNLVPPSAHDLLIRAWKAERTGDIERARLEYREAYNLNPMDQQVFESFCEFLERRETETEQTN